MNVLNSCPGPKGLSVAATAAFPSPAFTTVASALSRAFSIASSITAIRCVTICTQK
eukprot:CAMPEP_0185782244 /NCGR_PEP_ID=MMETSP1174-20130828/107538_1 /TAXON_ID=35687 /ORGANISM="Dictyocha speculum, Strain CCMP1381" /LENGTH=55 /DNA_ID=CAMNT_0028472607 /DNA_START=214 /DNA_END=381 /DNA_ORIENTATION=+